MFNDAIFARRVHTLKNKQDCPLILRVKLVLQVGKLFQTLLQGRSRVLLRPNARGIGRIERRRGHVVVVGSIAGRMLL